MNKKQENKKRKWSIKFLKVSYKFFTVWGLIGFIIFIATQIFEELEGFNEVLTTYIGGYLVYLFGAKLTTYILLSIGYWWLWLLIGYAFKGSYEKKIRENNKNEKKIKKS